MNYDALFGGFYAWRRLQIGDDIRHKPVPNWPHRRSYRTQVREARRRNPAKRGGAR